MTKELAYLSSQLKGPILRIEDPREYSVEQILKSYFREILVIARKYVRPAVEFEDLVVEGIIGLLDAISRWDPIKAKGNPKSFHQLAVVRIKNNMFTYLLMNSTKYATPHYIGRAMALVNQLRTKIKTAVPTENWEEYLLNPDCTDLESILPFHQVEQIKKLKERLQNLAESTGNSYTDMVEKILQIEQEIYIYEASGEEEHSPEVGWAEEEYLEKFLSSLHPTARGVIASLLSGSTLDEAGAEQGFSRERARQIKEGVLDFFTQTRMYKQATKE